MTQFHKKIVNRDDDVLGASNCFATAGNLRKQGCGKILMLLIREKESKIQYL